MEPKDFKTWRRNLKMSQKEAAQALGLKRRMIQYYEKGEREGTAVVIPLSVRLACYAIDQGIADYNGPHRKIHMREGPPEKPEKNKAVAKNKDKR